jgi:hypothetical protein
MNPQTSSSTTGSDSSPLHCQPRTASGRHCRMAVSDSDSGLCSTHPAQYQKEFDQSDQADKLIGGAQEFRSAVPINRCLGELLRLQASNKISPRRAAVVAYTCNLLLRTLPVIEQELYPEYDWPHPMAAGTINRPDQTS